MKNLGKFIGFISILAFSTFVFNACSNPAGGGGDPPYIITDSGSGFAATQGGVARGEAGQPIQTVINAIREHADGANVTIQFGSGGNNVLEIGNTSITFNNSGGNWGLITLRGSVRSTSSPTISIGDNVTITSTANIGISSSTEGGFSLTGSSNLTITGGSIITGSGSNGAVLHNSTGLLTISGGILSSANTNGTIRVQANSRMEMLGGTVRHTTTNNADGFAIGVASNLEDAVIISGGTVGSMTSTSVHGGEITEYPGMAIRSTGTGGITIGGSALITSGSTSNGTIRLTHASGGSLTIEGGTVRNRNPSTGDPVGPAITVNGGDNSRVTISGGAVTPPFP